jgi:CHAT domain-containing protein
VEEKEAAKNIGILGTMLEYEDAPWQPLVDGLQEHPLVHIASHTVYGENLFDNVLKLGGSHRLELLDIVRSRVPTTKVAFLLACSTAQPGDDANLVEGLHLATAMQCYEFRSVIGTMWAMYDGDGAELSRSFYRHMFSRRADDGIPLKERVAGSLRYAVQVLRQDLGKQREATALERWVNFVHYGT